MKTRTIPDFDIFYAQLSAGRLEEIYRKLSHPAITELLESGTGNNLDLARWQELAQKLPSISFDIAAAATTHMLHEYHDWLCQYLQDPHPLPS